MRHEVVFVRQGVSKCTTCGTKFKGKLLYLKVLDHLKSTDLTVYADQRSKA